MSGHTKEPWEHVETRVYLGNDGGFDLRDAPSPEANARRIVACVNVCAGLSDDDLKNGLTVIDAARSYLWQRNKLLVALRAFMELDKTFSTAKREHVEEFAKSGQKMAQAVLLARDAIAEVEASK